MRCGHCKEEHDTVAQVRECSTKDQLDLDSIPEGFYAVDSLTGNNDIDFFRVDKPQKGQWAGHTFVKQMVGGDQFFQQRGSRKYDALRAIAKAGWQNAGERFAAERRECYKCRTELTKYASRTLGLGRTCAEYRGVGQTWDRIQKEWEDAQREDEFMLAVDPGARVTGVSAVKVPKGKKARNKVRPLDRNVGTRQWPDSLSGQ